MFYCFIAEYGWPTLENWVKNIKVIDILEHRAVIIFCVQAGTSPMETKMFLDATKDGPHMSIFINKLTFRIIGIKMDELNRYILSTLPPYNTDQCTYWFCFIFLSKVKTEIFEPELIHKMSQETLLYMKTWQIMVYRSIL